MKYNFDEAVIRKNTNSIKWDTASSQDVLPMWVADMDFKTAPEIIEVLLSRVSHGIFGYTKTPEDFFASIINWWSRRHSLTIEKDWLIPVIGVIPALSAIIRSLLEKGDKVIIQPPVYNHFYSTIENCQCTAVENNLIYDRSGYNIDFEDLEIKASDPKVKMLLLSNPHNPAGRVWTREELIRTAMICLKHQVIIVSDEIHSDLISPGYTHIPAASLAASHSLNSITLSSPSKAFNLAGLQMGYVFTENHHFREGIQKVFQMQELGLLSPFAIQALIAAYDKGELWLEELNAYVHQNFIYLKQFIELRHPELIVVPLQATYLVWLDCRSLKLNSETIAALVLENHKLWINSGTMYGSAGEGFIRINIGCPKSILEEGLNRLHEALSENKDKRRVL